MAMPSWAAQEPDAIAIQLPAPLNDDKCDGAKRDADVKFKPFDLSPGISSKDG
jgi:hypothetical protein